MGKLKGNDATALRKKKFSEGTLRYNLFRKAQDTLKSGINLKLVVKKPHDETFDDWLAVHVVDFFNRVQLLYGTVAEVCTEESCPIMSGGPKYEYLWQDGVEFKKPKALSAPDYIDHLMDWIQNQIFDETLFPRDCSTNFPPNFKKTCMKILKRLYRVFVHVYIHHFDRITALDAEAHSNTLFKHYYYFVKEFHLVDDKEFEPLADLIAGVCND